MSLSRQKIYLSDDPIKNQHYCRTVTLNITFGAEVLRLIAGIYLKGTGLINHVQQHNDRFDPRVVEYIRKKNDLKALDISKLTVLLLDTRLNLEKKDDFHIDKLRQIRNKLCHSIAAELDNDTLFNESSQHIMRIVESVDKHNGTTYSREIADKINELKMRKQVPAYHISDRIALCNEKFWQMIRSGDNGDALKIRYGLTMFTKTLAANLNARIFLQILEEKEVISTELKSNIDLIYSNEKQIEKLVFHVVNEVDDTKVLLLCQCLRQTEKCGQALASMIEHNDDGGQTTDNLINKKIVSILKQSLEPSTFGSVISSEVHMYVEEKLGFESKYELIWKLIQNTFGMQGEMKESISRLKWKRGLEISERYRCLCTKNQKGTEGGEQSESVNVVLRKFDTPADGQTYKAGTIKTSNGNILFPSREFRHRSSEIIPTAILISTEIVRFAAACMNGRQNGTMYFGILNNKVTGIPRCECLDHLEYSVQSAIETCFRQNATEARLCIRPVQYIPVKNCNFVVIEADIVPHHIYLRKFIVPVWLPTKGKQSKEYCTYDSKVKYIQKDEIEKYDKRCYKLYVERQGIEMKIKDEIECQRKKLHDVLTEGHRYVTDAFYPIVVSGKISGSPNEITIRRQLDIEYALTSAVMILDFDCSASLQEKVEETNTSIRAMTTKDLTEVRSIGECESESIPWIYCNGYNRSKDKEGKGELSFQNWRKQRKAPIEKALQDIRDKYEDKCKVIFLVYQKHTDDTPDPMLKIALKITELFPHECLVIAENKMFIDQWMKTFQEEMYSDDLPTRITGLDWDSVSDVMKTSFRLNPDIECELPCRMSAYPVAMTRKEKSAFTDIDILSGKECRHQIELMNEISIAHMKDRTREDFYRGKNVSWWNFHFSNQVCERGLLDEICKDIDKWLSSGQNPVNEIKIHHHPGSGGTTIGKNILWRYSQFSQYHGKIENLYRCCTLKKFTDKTIDQLVRFREYKDKGDPKPIIILIDTDDTDGVKDFCQMLGPVAEKNTRLGSRFGLVVILQRESFEYTETRYLSHVLTAKENVWFTEKFEELEQEKDSKYVDTLIAFNFLKNSFDEEHINRLTETLLNEVREEEIEMLQCLAVIRAFEKERKRVPKHTFDDIRDVRRSYENRSSPWDLCLSSSMTHMLVQHNECVSLICQSLAKAIILRFKTSLSIDLPELIECLFKFLTKLQNSRSEYDIVRKNFTKIVEGLFKRDSHRRKIALNRYGNDREGDFSDLVKSLMEKKKYESSKQANQRVKEILLKCFDLTSDPMVAQQLVRFYIFIGEFAEAETLLKKATRKMDSYLLDTYGNIHKTHLVHLMNEAKDEEKLISDKKAATIIKMAFKAIEKFREGQTSATEEHPRNGIRNRSCFHNEIKTVLYLLDHFKHFKSYKDEGNFLHFLNNRHMQLDCSSFAGLVKECPKLRELRKGEKFQVELDCNVRYLRDSAYQTDWDVVTHQDDTRMVLTLFERIDFFYCNFENKDKSKYAPIDLQSLMRAMSSSKSEQERVKERVEIAQQCIEKGTDDDDRDFVILLGHKVLQYSSPYTKRLCSSEDYEQLLEYSKRLIKQQCEKGEAMLFLETFLFFGMIHWPTAKRALNDYDEFCSPKEYIKYINTWKGHFYKNLKLSTQEQKKRQRPKLLFALGKGSPGNDIVNLDVIESTIYQHDKERKPISRTDDVFWDEVCVEDNIERLTGTVEDKGSVISHEGVYSQGRTKCFKIELRHKYPSLQNKKVTFCLGFSWKGPIALGVKEVGENAKKLTLRNIDDRHRNISARQIPNPTLSGSPEHTISSLKTSTSGSGQPIKSSNFVLSRKISPVSALPSKPKLRENRFVLVQNPGTLVRLTAHRYMTEILLKNGVKEAPQNNCILLCFHDDPKIVRDAEKSRVLVEKIISSKPDYVVIHCIGQLDLVVIHVHEDTYVYHFYENEALLKEGHLHHLLVNKDINRVFYDIGSVSPDLITKYSVLMEGLIWDIQIMFKHVKLDKKEKDELIPYGYTDKIFQTWSTQNENYSKNIAFSNVDLNQAIFVELSERGSLTGQMYTKCKRKLDETVKETDIKMQLRKDIFKKAQPDKLKAEINKLRKGQEHTNKTDNQIPKHISDNQPFAGVSQPKHALEHTEKAENESGGQMSKKLENSFSGARPKSSKNVYSTSNMSPKNAASEKSYSQIAATPTVSHASAVGVKLSSSTLENVPSDRYNANWNTRQENAEKTEIEPDGQTSDRPGIVSKEHAQRPRKMLV